MLLQVCLTFNAKMLGVGHEKNSGGALSLLKFENFLIFFFVHFHILIFLGNLKKKTKFLIISNLFAYFSIWGRDFRNELILRFKICLNSNTPFFLGVQSEGVLEIRKFLNLFSWNFNWKYKFYEFFFYFNLKVYSKN